MHAPLRQFPPGDPSLRTALSTFATERHLTRTQLAVKLGINPACVAKYLAGTNDFDATLIDRLIPDLLKVERQKSPDAVALFPTFISERIAGSLETIQKTNDFGLIFSDAGLGKTSGLALFRQAHPLSLSFTASKGAADRWAVESAVFDLLETRGYTPRATRRWDFLVRHLRGSDRMLMIDNAQRLTRSALQWLFDFHDIAQVPIAIFGNPEVLDQIRRNDQMFSRIGLKDEIALPDPARARASERRGVEQVVDNLLARTVPDWAAALRPLARQIAWQRGHFRALRKTITLAVNLSLSGGILADPATAFKAAHLKLVRDYALEEGEEAEG